MGDVNSKTYMQLQLEELRTMHGVDADAAQRLKAQSGRAEDAEIAKLYADAAEYEEELASFERELEVIKTAALATLPALLSEAASGDAEAYTLGLKAIVLAGWQHAGKTEQAALMEATAFENIAEALRAAFPGDAGDFEAEIRGHLMKRWEMHIQIKKEHIKEEHSYIKALGLKPHYAKKVYNRYHGIA